MAAIMKQWAKKSVLSSMKTQEGGVVLLGKGSICQRYNETKLSLILPFFRLCRSFETCVKAANMFGKIRLSTI